MWVCLAVQQPPVRMSALAAAGTLWESAHFGERVSLKTEAADRVNGKSVKAMKKPNFPVALNRARVIATMTNRLREDIRGVPDSSSGLPLRSDSAGCGMRARRGERAKMRRGEPLTGEWR